MTDNELKITAIKEENLATYQCLSETDDILGSFKLEKTFRFAIFDCLGIL